MFLIVSVLDDDGVSAAATALAAELEDGSWAWEAQPEPLVVAATKVREGLQDGVRS